jgi:2-C-methyl-D-erythritol 4-phosphate cytidylyltransferase
VTGRVGAVLVAAGASRRMGFDKVWAALGEGAVINHALGALARSPLVDRVVLVVSPERLDDARQLAQSHQGVDVCSGGAERRDSVSAGARELLDCEWVLVHDAARPFVDAAMIERGLDAVRLSGVAVAAVPSKDTVKRVVDGIVVETLPRRELWNVQTPQVFRADLLREALARADRDVTDEATLAERCGRQVRVFPGSDANWKITTVADLELARALVAARGGAPSRRRGQARA